MSAEQPSSVFQVIDPDECLDLLGTREVGRLAYCVRGAPMIEPVNFVVDAGDVVIRIATGTKLAAVARDGVLCLEADDLDLATRTGWDVTVTGSPEWVENEAELSRLGGLLHPWAPGERPFFVRIKPERISGRRIVRS
jgi:nitroimidazol reductase NimA-like FMN-containing flavoprotein (pyridoxamine 5'-phosphate oxidase superfamily)